MAFFNKRYHPPGTAPGTLSSSQQDTNAPITIRLVDYNPANILIMDNVDATECRPFLEKDSMTWVHIQGQPSEAVLRELGQTFKLHELALEDVLNQGQRPKVEPFDDQLFIIMSLPVIKDDILEVQQISIFISSTFLISFSNGDFVPFNLIIKRMQDKNSRIRSHGIDFLLYSLLDTVIDQGFPVLEAFGSQLEDLEDQILAVAGKETLEKIHIFKRELILLRRMLWPQREVINQLLRDEHVLIGEDISIYFRDCYDHSIQVMDLLESYRDMTSSMMDIYLSSISNRMNDIMRVLTVISTTFIPLTFIVGVYGMNFDRSSPLNMPELGWHYGYPLVWAGMISIALLMLLFFRRRGWF